MFSGSGKMKENFHLLSTADRYGYSLFYV